MKARRRLLLPETLVFALALWVCGASFAFAATFTQSGNTVQVNTVNELASWTVAIHDSDSTESPIPTDSAHFWNSITVPAGQTAWSFVMPAEHRRYRFDVDSVRPSSAATDTMVMPSWSLHNGSGGLPDPRVVELVRGGSVVASAAIVSLGVPGIPADGWSCLSGDVLRFRAGVNIFAASAINITRTGKLQRGTLWLNEVNQGDEYSDDYWYSWSGAPIVSYGAAAVDDSGTGTFENPDWTGFLEPTPTVDPTSSVTPTSSGEVSGTVSVGGLGGLDSAGINALLAALSFTAGLVSWRQVVPHA